MIYWIIVALITAMAGGVGHVISDAIRMTRDSVNGRSVALARYGNPPDPSQVMFPGVPPGTRRNPSWRRNRPMMTLQQHLDLRYPLPPQSLFWQNMLRYDSLTIRIAVVTVLWPWLTLLSLVIFVASIKRARIKRAHVLRCAIYCSDAFIGLALLVPLLVWLGLLTREIGEFASSRLLQLILLGLICVVCYRLAVAFRVYLRFEQPVAIVVLSQLVVLLAVITYLAQDRHAYWLLFPF